MTQQKHMLKYWIEDKGIETALEEYLPDLLQKDNELKDYYRGYKKYKKLILLKAQEFKEAHEYEDNE
jgi:hypothetical protein